MTRYLVVADLDAEHRGIPIRTAPQAGGLLSISLADPNRHASGQLAPRLALRGVQVGADTWTPSGATALVFVQLTVPGLLTLVPRLAAHALDRALDLAAPWGDGRARALVAGTPALDEDDRQRAYLDSLVGALCDPSEGFDAARSTQLWRALVRHGRVDRAAAALGVSERWIQRTFREALGVRPKQLLGVHRRHRSLTAVQQPSGASSVEGYADQAHQIRDWRTHLGVTPGRYQQLGPSRMAQRVADSAFYL